MKIRKNFFKRVFNKFEALSIICTCLVTLFGMKLSIFQKIGLLKNCDNDMTIKGNIFAILVCVLSAIFGICALISVNKNLCNEEKQKKCRNIFSKDEMCKRYLDSLIEALKVTILVKDLEDLCEDIKQKEQIKDLRENCTILYQNCKTKKLIQELLKENVKLYQIPSEVDFLNIKGQIVQGPKPRCIFVEKKKEDEFQLLNIDNIFIQAALEYKINNVIEKVTHTS